MNKEFKKSFRIDELKVIEFNYWILSIRPQQVTVGSLVISLKRECASASKISHPEASELSDVFRKTEDLLSAAFQFDKINYLCLMMVDNQVHFHVIPRYKDEKKLDGVSYSDKFWPKPVNILDNIDDKGLALKILSKLKDYIHTEKKVVGYTTGVFDLFHVGHLNILRRAKQQCDYLIVGVTTDELSIERKGKAPVIPFEERKEILSNIVFVDEVVPQETMNKFAAWESYKFEKMFVGSDWKGTDKWNNLEVDFAKVGVDIIYFPYTSTTSSTLLKEKILKIK